MPDDLRQTRPDLAGQSFATPGTPPKRGWRGLADARLLRAALGLGLVVLAGVFLYDRFFRLEVADAVLEGAPVVLRAPLAGLLEAPPGVLPAIGDILPAGKLAAVVANPRADDSHRAELAAQVLAAEAELAALEGRVAHVVAELGAADGTGSTFQQARVASLRARLSEAQSATLAAEARAREAEGALQRTQSLFATGNATLATRDQAVRAAVVARAELRGAVERHAALSVELEAAARGVFATDAGTDRSASQQYRDRLRASAAELEAQRVERAARLAALRGQLQEETRRLDLLRRAELVLPVTARLLRRAVRPGEYVNAGQEVALLADCERPEVTAPVEPHVFRALRLGQAAEFLIAGEQAALPGRVVALRADRDRAAGGTTRLEVVVLLIPDMRRAAACETGRLGRLSF